MIRLADKNRHLQESLLKAEEQIVRLKAQVAGMLLDDEVGI
jgi:hypothetical protein